MDLNEAQRLAKACPTSSPQTFNAYIKTYQRKGAALTGTAAGVHHGYRMIKRGKADSCPRQWQGTSLQS